MALEQRIESLKKQHADIERAIQAEEVRPAPDEIRLHHLKREKLTMKDELSRLISERRQAA